MHSNYGQAYVTIVAAAGENCESGIPALQPRDSIQEVSSVGGLEIATSFLSIKNELSASRWSSRGWTLQEFVLSGRCLVFTKRQIFFWCGDGIRREDVNGELVRQVSRREISVLPILRPTFLSNRSPDDIVATDYNALISYAVRGLSFHTDAIKAFSDIMGALTPALGEFFWGVPEKYIRYCSTWVYHGRCRRRVGFPSWSWAG